VAVDLRRRPVARAPRRAPWWWVLRQRLRVEGPATAPFVLLAGASVVLLVLGLVMIFSASFVRSTVDTGDAFGIFTRQLLWVAAGLPPALLAVVVDYRVWRRAVVPALLVGIVLSALVLVPGLGSEVNGARRWFDLGVLSVQPSEIVKLAVPLAVARVVELRWRRIRSGSMSGLLLPAVPLIGVAAGLVLLGPDLETALLVLAIGGAALFAAGLPARIVLGAVSLMTAIGAASIATSEYRLGRVRAWLQPTTQDPGAFGYQTLQGFIALGSGGVFGVGLGQSRGKWLYVPNAHTDFIFAIIGEELGLVGACTVLALFVAIAVGGVLAAQRAPDVFGRLLAVGVTTWILIQAGINIGSVVGLLPVTGVTLPLVSFGGSSLVVTMVAIGLLLSVARHAVDAAELDDEVER